MKTSRTTRFLQFGAAVVASLALAFVVLVSWSLWSSRTRTVTISAEPLQLRNDTAAFGFAETSLRRLGYDPARYTPRPFWGGVLCGRNELNPDFGSFAFSPVSGPASDLNPGLYVRLEQHGTTITCSVAHGK